MNLEKYKNRLNPYNELVIISYDLFDLSIKEIKTIGKESEHEIDAKRVSLYKRYTELVKEIDELNEDERLFLYEHSWTNSDSYDELLAFRNKSKDYEDVSVNILCDFVSYDYLVGIYGDIEATKLYKRRKYVLSITNSYKVEFLKSVYNFLKTSEGLNDGIVSFLERIDNCISIHELEFVLIKRGLGVVFNKYYQDEI